MAKQYDRAYFDEWYRRRGFGSRAHLERKVRYAVASAEYVLERSVRSVLDVGCGEGAWQPVLRRVRPGASYLGVDPSPYAVGRYGRARNLVAGSLGALDDLRLRGPFDLVVCVDVLPYAPAADVRAGLRSLGSLLGGVALIELFTSADSFVGDRREYRRRPPALYERWFAEAGLCRIGPNTFAPVELARSLSHFERGR